MNIKVTKRDGGLSVVLDGRLDTTTAPELERILADHYGSIESLSINCERLVYISSAGLRVLLGAHKKTGGSMKLTGVCELVMEVLQMTGFSDILTIE